MNPLLALLLVFLGISLITLFLFVYFVVYPVTKQIQDHFDDLGENQNDYQ
jgi:F0F1-type ATP synthase membrane subunit b/b'